MSASRFRRSELARAALAMRDAGVDSYDVAFDDDGRPVVRVRPTGAAAEYDALDELNEWKRRQESAA